MYRLHGFCYLAAKHGAYGGESDDGRLEVLRWILFDNHKVTSYFASYRFMKAFGPSAPDPAVMVWLRGRLDNSFGILDKHLASRQFIVGAAPTIADMSISGYLFYPRGRKRVPDCGPVREHRCLGRAHARHSWLGRSVRRPSRGPYLPKW